MSIFKQGTKVKNDRFVAIIVGESGSGKTSQCVNLDASKVALITMEEGLLCFRKHNYMPRIVADVKTTDDLKMAYMELSKGIAGIEYIFIDSLTEIGNMVLTELKEDPKFSDPKLTLKMYMEYSDKMTKIIQVFQKMSNYSVIFTCLSEKEKDGLVTYDDFNIPGSSVKNNLKGWFDLVLHMKAYRDDDRNDKRIFLTSDADSRLAKDRSGILKEVEEANIANIIKKIMG